MAVRRCVVVVLIVALLALAALGGQPEAFFWAGIIGAIIAIPLLLPLGFILANAAGAAIIVGMLMLGPWLMGIGMFTGEDLDFGPLTIGIGVIAFSIGLLWYTLEVLLTGKTGHFRWDADLAGSPPRLCERPPVIVPMFGPGPTGSSC